MASGIEESRGDEHSVPAADDRKKPDVSVILPVYNERDNIADVTAEIADVMGDFGTPYEIIFVNDGSNDGSKNVLHHTSELFDEVCAVNLKKNFGQSAALSAGIEHARGDTIITMDADGQNDPHDIPRLLDAFENNGYDCVSGWRKDRHDSWKKTIPSAIQTKLARYTMDGDFIHDFGCTLKVYDAEALEDIELHGEGHRYIPAKLNNLGYRIGEEEVNHRERKNGETKYGAGRLVRGFVDLVFHTFWNRYSSRPLHFFGGLGFASVFIGMVLGLHMLAMKFLFGAELTPHLPRLVLIVGLVIFGSIAFFFGMITEFLSRMYYRNGHEWRVSEVIE